MVINNDVVVCVLLNFHGLVEFDGVLEVVDAGLAAFAATDDGVAVHAEASVAIEGLRGDGV
mgnify:CR=1 FL=1